MSAEEFQVMPTGFDLKWTGLLYGTGRKLTDGGQGVSWSIPELRRTLISLPLFTLLDKILSIIMLTCESHDTLHHERVTLSRDGLRNRLANTAVVDQSLECEGSGGSQLVWSIRGHAGLALNPSDPTASTSRSLLGLLCNSTLASRT
jgi:hypothetical protein